MKSLRGNCKGCGKPISWMAPVGGHDQNVGDTMSHIESQVFMSHSVVCGVCKTVNELQVDTVTLKIA